MPTPFHHLDHYIVFAIGSGKPVEGHSCQGSGNRAANILNEHNARCGHAERYEAKYIEKLDSDGMPK